MVKSVHSKLSSKGNSSLHILRSENEDLHLQVAQLHESRTKLMVEFSDSQEKLISQNKEYFQL